MSGHHHALDLVGSVEAVIAGERAALARAIAAAYEHGIYDIHEPARLPPPAGNCQARPADQDLVLRALTGVARAGPYFTQTVHCPAGDR
jgi:hypothetical protein